MRVSAWRLAAYVLVTLLGVLTALPNLLTPVQLEALPDWLPKRQVALGLDLRGGAHFVLEIDAKALADTRLQEIARSAESALKDARIAVSRVRLDAGRVAVDLSHAHDVPAAVQVLQRTLAVRAAGRAPDVAISAALSGVHVAPTPEGLAVRVADAAERSLEVVRLRVDELGLVEPTLQQAGADRIIVQIPGVHDLKRIKDALRQTAKLTFHQVRDALPGEALPPGVSWRTARNSDDRIAVEDRVMIGGDQLADAQPGFDSTTGEPVVTFSFDADGARRFAAITKTNVGRPFAILLDGRVLTAPRIEQPILGGTGQIKGQFSIETASDLAALLRAGALPAPLTVIEERVVGPDTGADAIESGLTAGLAGFVLVFFVIAALYGAWGLVANVALALNVILTFAALSMLGATLTLPGIAGIVLSLGLAVDANVLINERIREETRKGASAMAALDLGFRRASATILDSNLTALIATLLLFLFGSGPVRGFAVTMGLGIAISMFTAVTIVRAIMSEIVRRRGIKRLVIEPVWRLGLVRDGTAVPFMRARVFGLVVSTLLSAASVGLFVVPGLNYGVDFKGGIQVEIATAQAADLAKLREGLSTLGLGDVGLQAFDDGTRVLVRVERQAGGEEAQAAAVERLQAKLTSLAPGATIERSEAVGPRISGELAATGILAVVLASLAMLAYIWLRFEWPFAVGAIATLMLDVTKTVGFFALSGLEFNLTAIAALLTLIGYSVNDKVVVYDRMRENMRLLKATPLRDIIDRSINETLGRSLYTSVTALVSLLPMAIWGGPAVQSFAVPMIFGIVVAASSSVFIAAPILLFLGDWRRRRSAVRLEEVATGA